MKTTTVCPICGIEFTRVHTVDKPPKFCSRACANKAPGRLTEEIRLRMGRPQSTNKGGSITRGRKGKPYYELHLPLRERALHPTVSRRGRIRRSHYVWNNAHPDNPVLPGEVIHHLDEDSINDVPGNLEKLPNQSVHATIHFSQPRGPMSEAHKSALSAAKRWIPDRDCEQCGTPLSREQIGWGSRFCSARCGYIFRTGKPRSGF